MIKSNKNILLIAALLCSTIGLAGCPSSTTTNNSNTAVVVNNNKASNTTAPANTTKTETTTTTGDKVGVAECDEYIEKMEACFTKMPEAQRGMVKNNFDTLRKSWKDAASTPNGKAGLATGCKAALDVAKQSYNYCTW